MAPAKDLSWVQLAQEVDPEIRNTRSLLFLLSDSYGARVVIDISVLFGRDITYESDTGVIESLLKLRELAVKAQATVNQGKVAGEKLNAFPAANYGAVANGFSTVSGSISARIPVNVLGTGEIVGPNI